MEDRLHRRLVAFGVVAGGAALAAASLLVVAGPAGAAGIADKSPAAIQKAATKATTGAKSVTIKGHVTSSGELITIDASEASNGTGTGTLGINGQNVKILRIGDKVYFNGSTKFWTEQANAAAASLLAGKWLEAPTSNKTLAGLASFLDKSELLSSTSSPPKGVTKVGTKTVGGKKAIVLKAKGGNVAYVAASGPPYLLGLSGSGSTLTFSNYNKPVHVQAPQDTLNYDELTKGQTSS